MAKTMTASMQPMTDGQIDNLVDKFRAAVRKHRNEFRSETVQQVLGVENLGMELLAPFRKRVEATSNLIVRHVSVNRNRIPQETLNATGRKQYVDGAVLNVMPQGEDTDMGVFFFNLGRFVSGEELEKEYDLRGLKPADPYAVAAVNEADPVFADEYPNATHWKDADGKWCYAAFRRWDDKRLVVVDRRDDDWDGHWWFAGFRK